MNSRRLLLIISILCLCFTTQAGAIDSVTEGSLTSTPFLREGIQVNHEKIRIVPNKECTLASFFIEYSIQVEKQGDQIPMLFYVSENENDFNVWLDDKKVQMEQVPSNYEVLEGSPFAGFNSIFEFFENDSERAVKLRESPSDDFSVVMEDLKFFRSDLSSGKHIIRVEYEAERWIDPSKGIDEYSFRYTFSPANYWKSFGELEVVLDAHQCDKPLKTNLGLPTSGSLESKATWMFRSLPKNILMISYKPESEPKGGILKTLIPFGLTCILLLFFIILHIYAMKKFREKNFHKRFSPVMVIGSISIPFLLLFGYVFFSVIVYGGKWNNEGYLYLVLFLYPVILPFYWGGMWFADTIIKNETREKHVLRKKKEANFHI